MTETPIVDRVAEAIRQHHRFIIATHIRPDGDAAGSLLGMTLMLRRLGKVADPFCNDPVPPSYEFLPGVRLIQHRILDPSGYDAAILLDCGDYQRVGTALAESIRSVPRLINIDHHISEVPYGDIAWVDSSASSTCEMLYELARRLPVPLDAEIATPLYTGVLTDTGSFRYSNTNHRVLSVAARLCDAGAQPAQIASQVYESGTPERLRLLGQVLSTVHFYSNERIATAEVTQAMFAKTATSPTDSDSFINHLRSIRSVDLAILFREEKNGIVHVSMRSKGSVDVAAFAQKHNGGGHRNAAAFRVAGAIGTIRPKVTNEALSILPTR